mgnify:CR=1 FL=1
MYNFTKELIEKYPNFVKEYTNYYMGKPSRFKNAFQIVAYIYDLKLPPGWAVLISCGLPLLLFLLGFRNFIMTLGFVGTVVGAIEGAIIILIFKRAKTMGDRTPEYNLKIPSFLAYFLIAIFVFGALSQFISR